MTPAELRSLTYFSEHEQYLDGQPVDWALLDWQTMYWMNELRDKLDAPIRLIYNPAHLKTNKVDACCPGVPLEQVYMSGLSRVQQCSWGVYSGGRGSWHIDTREFEYFPARWMGIKPEHKRIYETFGLGDLVQGPVTNGWIYIAWDAPGSFQALKLLFAITVEGSTLTRGT